MDTDTRNQSGFELLAICFVFFAAYALLMVMAARFGIFWLPYVVGFFVFSLAGRAAYR